MNIGLIILLSSIMLGTNGKNDADNSKIEATIEKYNNSQKSELKKRDNRKKTAIKKV